jgi:hypothetical protein
MTHEFWLIQVLKSLSESHFIQSLKMKVKSTCKIHLILTRVGFCKTKWPENMGLSDTNQNTQGFVRKGPQNLGFAKFTLKTISICSLITEKDLTKNMEWLMKRLKEKDKELI